jgi:hypothetical protein
MRTTNKKMLYGTKMKEAENIMANPTRQVLMVTEQQRKTYSDMWYRFYNKEFKI